MHPQHAPCSSVVGVALAATARLPALVKKRTWHKPKTTRNLDQQTLLKAAAAAGSELKLTNTSFPCQDQMKLTKL